MKTLTFALSALGLITSACFSMQPEKAKFISAIDSTLGVLSEENVMYRAGDLPYNSSAYKQFYCTFEGLVKTALEEMKDQIDNEGKYQTTVSQAIYDQQLSQDFLFKECVRRSVEKKISDDPELIVSFKSSLLGIAKKIQNEKKPKKAGVLERLKIDVSDLMHVVERYDRKKWAENILDLLKTFYDTKE